MTSKATAWVHFCIRNKLVIYLLAIAICLAGLFCLFTIPIAPAPQISMNRLHIRFSYPGASASTVQTQVTDKVMDTLKGTENVQEIDANSSAGSAVIGLTLNTSNPDIILKTQIKIMQAIASSHLPTAVPQPEVSQAATNSGLITFVVSSDQLNTFQLNNFIQSRLYPKFSSLPGVSLTPPAEDPVIKIKLLPEKLSEYHLSPINISNIINNSYRADPLGNMYLQNESYTLDNGNNIHTLNQLKNLVIGSMAPDGTPIFLKDIAKIQFENRGILPNAYSAFDGHKANTISLYTTALANPFLISKQTREYVKTIEKSYSGLIKITPISDVAKMMKTSFYEVAWTILIASILVLLTALIFLGNFRSTLIPIATIPICLLGSVVFMNFLGYSINIISLLAMVIAVGLVVDDAIVVVENITRYLEQGIKKHEAVVQGTSSISLTIIGITLTLLAVYVPISFFNGPFISFFKVFALTLSAAVFISGIVALTLTPIMCLVLLDSKEPNSFQKQFNSLLNNIINLYHKLLAHVLNKPFFSLLIILLLITTFGYLDLHLPKRFFPVDPDGIIHIMLTGGKQDSIKSLKDEAKKFGHFYSDKTVDYYSLEINKDPNTNQITGMLNINYKKEYLHQSLNYVSQINNYIKQKNIGNAIAQVESVSGWGSGADLSISLYGAGNVAKMNQNAKKLTKLMRSSSLFSNVNNTINPPHKQIELHFNTIEAARYGILQPQITNLLSIYYGGFKLDNNFDIDGLSVPIVLQLPNWALKNPQLIERLPIHSSLTNKFYSLGDFVSLKTVAKPEIISSLNGRPSVTINANLAKGASLGSAINYTNDLISKYMPLTQYLYTGNAHAYLQGNNQSLLIVIFGMFCIYFLLAVLFSSLLDPFIILLTVPFSIVGGALWLYLIDGSINLYSTVALITLIGLITKHGVLIVQFANHELEKGLTPRQAIITATHHRFRPIIMTTLAMSLGALPLLLSHDLMYVARRDLGIVIIGGLLTGTLFSLFIIPLVYTLLKRVALHSE